MPTRLVFWTMPLDEDMKRVVSEQSLGFVATVCPDGTPNVSPKGTLAVWDDEHLAFLDLRSPRTMRNIASNTAMEVNVVDPILRKGYRFKGTARIIHAGPELDRVLDFYKRAPGAARDRVRAAVIMHVERVAPLVSPAYDLGATEDEVAGRWRDRHLRLTSPL